MLQEFYQVAFRKNLYRAIDELQADLDEWMQGYNELRPHQGRWCYGKTLCRNSTTHYHSRLSRSTAPSDFVEPQDGDKLLAQCPKKGTR